MKTKLKAKETILCREETEQDPQAEDEEWDAAEAREADEDVARWAAHLPPGREVIAYARTAEQRCPTSWGNPAIRGSVRNVEFG